MLSLLSLLLLLSPTISGAEKLIFILAGQSNMAGRGGVTGDKWDHVIPQECRPSPSIHRLSAALNWELAAEPLHADIDVYGVCGVGPGMAFADAVQPKVGGDLGLVPCAVGATAISQWEKGTALYEKMVRRARAAGGRIGAVLWYQGESDTVSMADAEAYKGRVERFFQDVRSDLGDSDLLVIQVALATGMGKFIEPVREAQKAIKIHNVLTVDAKGLQAGEDYVHLTTQAQVQLGKMLAAAYLNHVASTHQHHL